MASKDSQIPFPTAETIFSTASKNFYDNLTDEVKKDFQTAGTAKEMVTSIQEHIKSLSTEKESRLLEACKKIDRFGKALEPFFKIVEISVSSDPNWAATIWGAIRMVFLLSSHFTGFFEKLAAMFDKFYQTLPNYEAQIKIINARVGKSACRETQTCLLKALSLIYTDILQFCHDAYRLFSKKRHGVRYRPAVIWDLFWTPCDERFSGVLSRMKRHQEAFSSGLKLVYSEEIIRQFNEMDRERQLNAQYCDKFTQEQQVTERKAIDEKLHTLQRWISAPNWTDSFEAAKRKRLQGSGRWILRDSEYQNWKTNSAACVNQATELATSFLVMAGKPGYGKTILSTSIIDDLQRSVQRGDLSGVGYFHFDHQAVDKSSGLAALRAVAAQLLFANRYDKKFVDISSFLTMEDGHGQINASEYTLETLIRNFAEELDASYFVFDGLDECSDWEEFILCLRRCTDHTPCKSVIITRPHLRVSELLGGKPFILKLEQDANLSEIETFLMPGIRELIESGKLGQRYGPETTERVVHDLARQSDSIFLWAQLMLKHLQSSALTRNERVELIDQEKPFTGLKNLYAKILHDMRKRLSQSELSKVQKVFEWLITAQVEWSSNMLEAALAVHTERASTRDDYLENFDEAIVQLCGPMVEIRHNGKVRFIHLSAGEYLSSSEGLHKKPALAVNLCSAHGSAAILCIRYLMNEIPPEPLSGNALSSASPTSVLQKYPFLSYAAAYWARHVLQALDQVEDDTTPTQLRLQPGKEHQSLLLSMSRMIADKCLMSVWIEASWLFGLPPTVLELPQRILQLASLVSQALSTQLKELSETLQRLSKNLSLLNKSWGPLLSAEPNEIWLPSVNSLTDSEFWVGTTSSQVSWLPSHDEEASILITSKVSEDGRRVGIVRVLPSETSEQRDSATDSDDSTNPPPKSTRAYGKWTVVYQIWDLEGKQIERASYFEISQKDILPIFGRPDDFRFPVAISPSLRFLCIMGSIVQAVPHHDDNPDNCIVVHPLFDPKCPARDFILLRSLHRPIYLPDLDTGNASVAPGGIFHNWYSCYFSPCERYMTVLKGVGPPNAHELHVTWILDIFENIDLEAESRFRLIAQSGVWLNGNCSRPIVFHPSKPVMAICLRDCTVIWRFKERDSKFLRISVHPLNHMSFSNCGHFLHGTKTDGDGEPVFVHVTPIIPELPEVIGALKRDDSSSAVSTNANTNLAGKEQSITASLNQQNSGAYTSGVPIFSASQENPQICVLTQNSGTGSVILQTMSSGGRMTQEMLARLPTSSTLEKSYSNLVPTNEHSNLRLVLNMAVQDSYSLINKPDFRLPAIIDRAKDSIPVQTYTPKQRISNTTVPAKREIEHIDDGYSQNNIVAKKRT